MKTLGLSKKTMINYICLGNHKIVSFTAWRDREVKIVHLILARHLSFYISLMKHTNYFKNAKSFGAYRNARAMSDYTFVTKLPISPSYISVSPSLLSQVLIYCIPGATPDLTI